MSSSVRLNAAITACTLGLLGLLVGCFDLSVSFETTKPDTSSPTSNNSPQIEANSTSPIANEVSTASNISNSTTTTKSQADKSLDQSISVLTSRQESAVKGKVQGALRMSNQTDQPVRLALLARQSLAKGSAGQKTNYDLPAHWDFDPQEGGEKGLILSLPNGNLKLEKGDILVAFAQDGSRRYWGPYVVGETPLPQWNAQNKEWLLVLSR